MMKDNGNERIINDKIEFIIDEFERLWFRRDLRWQATVKRQDGKMNVMK